MIQPCFWIWSSLEEPAFSEECWSTTKACAYEELYDRDRGPSRPFGGGT